MRIPTERTSSSLLNNHISFIYKVILPIILVFILVNVVLGLKIHRKKENWVNYANLPFGELRTGKDCPLNFYERPQYRLPYRWPLGIRTTYPDEHIAPFML